MDANTVMMAIAAQTVIYAFRTITTMGEIKMVLEGEIPAPAVVSDLPGGVLDGSFR